MPQSESNLPKLDFLRSVAVMLVVVNHLLTVFRVYDPWTYNLGSLGVYLFFIHTSYVLMLSLERMRTQSEGSLWSRFMVRRCFRIYPLSIFILLSMLAFHIPRPVGPFSTLVLLHPTRLEWLSNLSLTLNLSRARPILTPLWSLPYELTMYVFLPGLFYVASRRRAVSRIAVMWFAAAVIAAVRTRYSPIGILDFLTFAPMFLSGILAYSIARSVPARIGFRMLPLALAGAISVMYFSNHHVRNLVLWPLLLGIGVLLPVVAEPSNRLLNAITQAIARYSYGIYIAHVFCLWLAFYVVHTSLPLRFVILVASLVVFPAALYHGLEAPMIRLGRRWTRPAFVPVPAAAVPAEA